MKITDREIKMALISGKRIRRKGWLYNKNVYARYDIDSNFIYGGSHNRFELDFSDIMAEDWMVVNE